MIGIAIINKKREVEWASLSQGLLRFKELRVEFSYGSDVVSENPFSYRQVKCMQNSRKKKPSFAVVN